MLARYASALRCPTRLSHSSTQVSPHPHAHPTLVTKCTLGPAFRRLKPLQCRNCCPVKQQRDISEIQVARSRWVGRSDPHPLRSTRNIAPVGEHVWSPDRLRMPQQGRSSDSLCSGWGAHLPASWTRPRRRSRSRRPLWSRAWWSTARAPQRRHTQCLAAAMARLSGQNLSRCSERGASVRHRLHGACQSSWRWTEN